MCCAGISFTNLNIKILGPRIDGSIVDDLADLIDGDGDGKCREANGDFIPCPPKELVEQVRNLRQRVARFNTRDDTDGQILAGEIEVQVNRLRRGDFFNARGGLSALEDALRGREGKPARPQKPNAPDAPLPVRRFRRDNANALFERAKNVLSDIDNNIPARNRNTELRNLISKVDDQRYWLKDRLGWLRWRDQDEFSDTQLVARYNDLQQRVYELEKIAALRQQNQQKPKAPAQRNTPEARQERHSGLIVRANAAMRRGGVVLDRLNALRAANAAIDDYRAEDTDKKLDAFENLLNEIEKIQNNLPNAAPAQQAAEADEAVGDIDVDAIIQERRKTAKAKAKKIAENAKKFIPQEVRNFFQRRSINNMDKWVTGTPQEQQEKLQKWARRMFENTFEDLNGRKYTVKIDDGGLSISRNGASIEGAIYDDNGEEAGRFYRTFDFGNKSVYHNSFSMNEDQRGNGVGSAFVRASEILYKKAGFEKISVTGASSNYGYKGATHWPKMGFDWANNYQKSEFLSIIQIAVGDYDEELFSSRREFEEIRALLKRALQDSPNDPNRVLPGDLLRFKGAEKHFQNENAMIGYKLDLKES